MSEPMEKILKAHKAIEAAKKEISSTARAALKETLSEIFMNPNINSIIWSQRSAEYDDQGLYDGVWGLSFNSVDIEDIEGVLNQRGIWSIYHSKGGANGFKDEYAKLDELLKAIGPEVLEDIFRYSSITVAYRVHPPTDGNAGFRTEAIEVYY